MHDPVALLRRYHAALEPYDRAVVAPLLAAGAVYHSPGLAGVIAGRDAILAAFDDYFAAHPDQRSEDSAITAAAPRAARAIWQLRATHAPTGRTVLRRGIETIGFDTAGRILRVVVEDG